MDGLPPPAPPMYGVAGATHLRMAGPPDIGLIPVSWEGERILYSPDPAWRFQESSPISTGETNKPRSLYSISSHGEMAHNIGMTSPISRPELDAKLETIEARMDGRLARIEDAVKRISEDNASTRASISNLKTTMVVTAVGAVLTVLFGVAAFNATLLSNMTSSFDSGRETAKLAAEAQTKSAQTQEQTARLIADAEVKAAQAQKDTAATLAEIRAIVSDLNKKQQ